MHNPSKYDQRILIKFLGNLRGQKKRPSMLTTAVITLHGISRPHVARTIQDTLRSMRCKVLEHPL
jgi:hypothetical protein